MILDGSGGSWKLSPPCNYLDAESMPPIHQVLYIPFFGAIDKIVRIQFVCEGGVTMQPVSRSCGLRHIVLCLSINHDELVDMILVGIHYSGMTIPEHKETLLQMVMPKQFTAIVDRLLPGVYYRCHGVGAGVSSLSQRTSSHQK
jgi:hypothetical protein